MLIHKEEHHRIWYKKMKGTSQGLYTAIYHHYFPFYLKSFFNSPLNPFPPISANWHLYILLCLTPDDFTRQWGTPWEVKG